MVTETQRKHTSQMLPTQPLAAINFSRLTGKGPFIMKGEHSSDAIAIEVIKGKSGELYDGQIVLTTEGQHIGFTASTRVNRYGKRVILFNISTKQNDALRHPDFRASELVSSALAYFAGEGKSTDGISFIWNKPGISNEKSDNYTSFAAAYDKFVASHKATPNSEWAFRSGIEAAWETRETALKHGFNWVEFNISYGDTKHTVISSVSGTFYKTDPRSFMHDADHVLLLEPTK